MTFSKISKDDNFFGRMFFPIGGMQHMAMPVATPGEQNKFVNLHTKIDISVMGITQYGTWQSLKHYTMYTKFVASTSKDEIHVKPEFCFPPINI